MANSNRGNKDRDVTTDKFVAETVNKESVVDALPAVAKSRVASGDLHPKVQKTLDSAMKDGRVKIKSKANYDAAKAVLKVSNPKNLTVVHKPGLGHHSIAVK